jgi:hypothetical protein
MYPRDMDIRKWILTILENENVQQSNGDPEPSSSDLPGDVLISRERELLFRQVRNDQNALYTTYNRYYTGARYVGYLSWITTTLTAIIGALLLTLLSSSQNLWIFTEESVTLLLVAVSLLSAFYSPQGRSVKYYKSGQQLQEIYDEYENFVNLEVANLSRDIQNLKKEYERLHRRRHLANQGAPQLSGIWYQILNILFGSSLVYKLFAVLEKVKNQTIGRLISRWRKTEREAEDEEDSRSDQQNVRYQHSCGSDKSQWEETLCEKIANHGHPPAYSDQRD